MQTDLQKGEIRIRMVECPRERWRNYVTGAYIQTVGGEDGCCERRAEGQDLGMAIRQVPGSPSDETFARIS